MTAQSQEAWDAWSSYTVELRVVSRVPSPHVKPAHADLAALCIVLHPARAPAAGPAKLPGIRAWVFCSR